MRTLQRGRARLSAEGWARARGGSGITCFNGAALNGARNVPGLVKDAESLRALQQGRAQLSAEGQTGDALHLGAEHASTGPRSNERGMRLGAGRAAHDEVASTGPHSAARGNGRRSVLSGVRDGTSTGPRSVERGRDLKNPPIRANVFMLQRGRAQKSAEGDALCHGNGRTG